MREFVVLVDEQDNQIGIADKTIIHTANTPLHRAFSLFLFNSKKQILLTKRAKTKNTFPGVWTNTVCGHPGVDETREDAAKRRLHEELGIGVTKVQLTAPYRYRFADSSGILENEICPIFIAFSDSDPVVHPEEVDDWKWMDWRDFIKEISINPTIYSPWSVEEAFILQRKDLETL